jgi:LmbE family N-acetylglucosaminyl deacetylase
MTLKSTVLKIKKFLLAHSIGHIQKHEQLIKLVEYTRGLYRYPNKMLGRECSISNQNEKTDVLVFAAHPDDEILGLGTTLYRHKLKGDKIKIVFTTNGTGRESESWYIKTKQAKKKFEIRYAEAAQALALINIPKENIQSLGYPDGGTQRYLKEITKDIQMIIEKLNPGRIYVHCIEGGHGDHDLTSYVVKSVCQKLGYRNVFEWAEYNPIQPIGSHEIRFISKNAMDADEIIIDISKEERSLKRKMLFYHQSQEVEQYFMMGEAIREADLSEMEAELLKYCNISKRRLLPLLKRYKNFKNEIKSKAISGTFNGINLIGVKVLIDTMNL